jgi:hypothetical protein
VQIIKKETVEAVSMTRFVGTPLRGTEFANAGDEAISARVGTDSYPRVRIDAGGRITWSSGTVAGDTTLYRDSANILKTDDVFQAFSGVVTLATTGIPTTALADGALAVDTTNDAFYFRSGGEWIQVSIETTLDGLTDVVITTPTNGQVLKYNGTNWINGTDDAGTTIDSIDDIDDVVITSVATGEVLAYNGTNWVNSVVTSYTNIDGGLASTDYTGVVAIDGGSA